MRKLATIQTIQQIEPHPNADNLDILTLKNWKTITRKNEFQIGEKCVFFEIDSFLPETKEFEFLRESSFKKMNKTSGFLLKSVKLRGIISQGLAMKPSVFKLNDLPEGYNLTKELGVELYEPILPFSDDITEPFPIHLANKTNLERVQNLTKKQILLEGGELYEVTEKLDGTSCTIIYDDGKFMVCSKNWQLKESPNSVYWNSIKKPNLFSFLQILGKKQTVIQGEIIGPKIQKNNYDLPNTQLRVFNVSSPKSNSLITNNTYIKQLKLNPVPIIDDYLNIKNLSITDIIEMSDGPSELNPSKKREGLIFRSILNPSFSFKTISNDYLLNN